MGDNNTGALLVGIAAFCVIASAWCALVAWRAVRGRRDERAMNPHARLLGQVVEARIYEASDWERCVVVAVGWHGAVCLRREDNQGTPGRWIPSYLAASRVREVGDGDVR